LAEGNESIIVQPCEPEQNPGEENDYIHNFTDCQALSKGAIYIYLLVLKQNGDSARLWAKLFPYQLKTRGGMGRGCRRAEKENVRRERASRRSSFG
jgi:hypothetical protein